MEEYENINEVCEKLVIEAIALFRRVNPYYSIDPELYSSLKNEFVKAVTEKEWTLSDIIKISKRALESTKRDIARISQINPYHSVSLNEFLEVYTNHIENLTNALTKSESTKSSGQKQNRKPIDEVKTIDLTLGESMIYAVFICHAEEDKQLANLIKSLLKDFNITSFIAHDDIKKGKKWEPTILDTLEKSKIVLVLGTKHVEKSAWVNFETGLGYNKMFPLLFDKLSDEVSYIKNVQGIIADYKNIKKTILALMREIISKLGITTDKDDNQIISLGSFKKLEEYIIKKYP